MELRGRNQIGEFKQIAEKLKSEIVSHRGVAGIIFMGGLVRGFADKYSDVDIVVLVDENNEDLKSRIRKIGSDEQKSSGIDIDLEVHSLLDFERLKWDETAKWDFSHADVVFDTQGRVRHVLRQNTRVKNSFWTKRIVVYGEYIKWYGCPTENAAGSLVETWVERGDLASAQYCVSYALELLMAILFALNKEFLPPQKWRLFYSRGLKWLPADYEKLHWEAMRIGSLSKRDLERRLKALRKMWGDTLPKVKEETGLTPNLISEYYVKRILHQT